MDRPAGRGAAAQPGEFWARAVKIAGFDIFTLAIPLVASHLSRATDSGRFLLVRLRDETGGQGWGECPLTERNPAESGQGMPEILRHMILEDLAVRDFDNLASVIGAVGTLLESASPARLAACCAVESALLDMVGRRQFQSAGEVLGRVRRTSVVYGARIFEGGNQSVSRQALALLRAGVRQVTLEIGADPDTGRRRVESVREILGDGVELRICPGGTWSAETAIRELEAMGRWHIAGVEQPVPSGHIDMMSQVTASGLVPVIATGAVTSRRDVIRLASERACDVVGIRLSECGGLGAAAAMHRIARDAGLGCQLVAEDSDAGLLAVAGLQFACRAEGVHYAEWAPTLPRLPEPLTDPAMEGDPAMPVNALRRPGLGVRIDADAVERFASRRISVN